MKIGVAANKRDDRFNPIYEHLPCEAVLYDVELPVQVRRGLEIISEHMSSRKEKIPLANQTEQAHHDDYGLVFRVGEIDSVKLLPEVPHTDFTKGILVARISMGMPKTDDGTGEEEIVFKDPRGLARLHLNVYGARNFLPIKEEKEQDFASFGYTSEIIHFSLRWVNEQFDNLWNDAARWLAEKDSHYLDKPQFNPMRTTYYKSDSATDHVNGNFYRNLSGYVPSEITQRIEKGKKILTLKDVEEVIGPRKPRFFPENISVEEFLKLFPEGTQETDARESAGYESRKKNSFPHIGYSPVCELLSKFGEISTGDSDRIPEMSRDQGVEYIFGKVLPAVKKFTQT